MKMWVIAASMQLWSGVANAAEKCWSYERIENFKVSDKLSGQEVRDFRLRSAKSYATKEECDAVLSTKENVHESNNIYVYYDIEYSDCTCSGGTPSAADPLEADFERRVVDGELRDWFLGIINPVSRENLLTLASLYPENAYFAAALQAAGTVLAPVLMAKGYVEMADRVMDASLDRALGVLNVPLDRRADFIAASGVFVRGYDHPTGSPFESYYRAKSKPRSVPAEIATYVLDETQWPQIAVATSLRLVAQNDTPVDSYALAAALGLGGYFALREGHAEAGKQLLLGALGALATVKAGSPAEVEELLRVLERANQQYGAGIPASRFAPATKAPSAASASPFAGQFRCGGVVSDGSTAPQHRGMVDQACATPPVMKVVQGTSWHQMGPYVVEVDGSTVRITNEQEYYNNSGGSIAGGVRTPPVTLHYARTCVSSRTITGSTAHLTGSCTKRALMPMRFFTEGVDMTYEQDLELSPDGSVAAHTTITSMPNADQGIVRWVRVGP